MSLSQLRSPPESASERLTAEEEKQMARAIRRASRSPGRPSPASPRPMTS